MGGASLGPPRWLLSSVVTGAPTQQVGSESAAAMAGSPCAKWGHDLLCSSEFVQVKESVVGYQTHGHPEMGAGNKLRGKLLAELIFSTPRTVLE